MILNYALYITIYSPPHRISTPCLHRKTINHNKQSRLSKSSKLAKTSTIKTQHQPACSPLQGNDHSTSHNPNPKSFFLHQQKHADNKTTLSVNNDSISTLYHCCSPDACTLPCTSNNVDLDCQHDELPLTQMLNSVLNPAMRRTMSSSMPSPTKILSRSSTNVLGKDECFHDAKRVKRLNEESWFYGEMNREYENTDPHEGSNHAIQDDLGPPEEEDVKVEKMGECLGVQFKCPCGSGYHILLAGSNCYYKLT